MKGIILAGGSGTRLYPLTRAVSKQILPVYDKPMIYYPLSVLMLAGIRDILVISTERDSGIFRELFGDGSKLGMRFEYAVQKTPRGLADAFIVGEDFIGADPVALVLGDNIFYGRSFAGQLKTCVESVEQIVEFNPEGRAVSIEEKPSDPKSNYAVPGLYFYDNSVVSIAKDVKPSSRGEIEITAVNNEYLSRNSLSVEVLGRGMAWLDTGTYDGLLEASNFIATIQKRQGMYVACIEEIAFANGWLSRESLLSLAAEYKTDYGEYLRYIADSADIL